MNARDEINEVGDLDTHALRESFRDVLETECGLDALRRHLDGDESLAATLQRNATELGWHGIVVPENYGGIGMGYPAQMALYREIGRALAPVPALPTALGADALLRGTNRSLMDDWLPRIAAGEIGVTVALPPNALALNTQGDTLILNGTARRVLLGSPQDALVLFAADEKATLQAVFCEPGDAQIRIDEAPVWDHTRRLADIRCEMVKVASTHLLSADGSNAEALAAELLRHASLAMASDAIGGAERIFELTVDYLNTRIAFGRLIGSFQALKHRCADLKISLRASTALTDHAIASLVSNDASAPVQAALAKSYACDTYAHVASDAVQLHGGIGYTWEHHCHLFLKRAKLTQFLFGDSARHRDRAFELLLETA